MRAETTAPDGSLMAAFILGAIVLSFVIGGLLLARSARRSREEPRDDDA